MNHLVRIFFVSFAVLTVMPNGNTLFGMKRKFLLPHLIIPKNESKTIQKEAEEAFYAELYSEGATADRLRPFLNDWLDTLKLAVENISPSVHYHRDASDGMLVRSTSREVAQRMLLNGIVRQVLREQKTPSGILEILLDLGADTWVALLAAARQNDAELVDVVLLKDSYAVNYQNEMSKETAFIYAVKHNNFDMLYSLVGAFKTVSQLVLDEWDQCPEDVYRVCMQPFSDPINAQDARGYTPIMYAVEQDNALMVKYLLENGADVSITNDDNETALELATSSLIKFLITKSM
jgi:hypothetical protein